MDDIHKTLPDLQKKTERMVQAGIWMVFFFCHCYANFQPPGYREKFGDLTIM
jgi:hypothetical protein